MDALLTGRRWAVTALATLAMLVLASGTVGNIKRFQPAPVSADASNPVASTIHATITDPNADGSLTVYIRGQWNWYTHSTDCNFDRAGAGVGLIWNDPSEPGYPVANDGNPPQGVGVSTLRTGDTHNTKDRMVHPADVGNVPEGYPGNAVFGQTFNDPAPDPNNYGSWRGGCGREATSSTASPCTTPNIGYTNYGCQSPTAESTGHSCSDGTTNCNGHPWGSWGYTKNAPCTVGGNATTCTGYSHTYAKASDLTKVCVNIYDVYNGGGGFVPADATQIDVTQNTDNSIATNDFSVTMGTYCVNVAGVPTVATTQSPTTGTVNSTTFTDTATVSGGNSPTGAVTFNLYSSNNCTGSVFSGPGTLSAGTYSTAGTKVSTTGTFYWVASQAADANNTAARSGCAAEPITVSPAQPTVATTQSPTTGTVNSTTFADTATVSGGNSPTGAVTFTLYSNNNCTGSVFSGPGTLNAGVYSTTGTKVTSTGTFYWVASQAADSNNAAASSVCSAEPITVSPAQPTVATTQSPTTGTVNSTTFADTATVSGGDSPTGAVTFTLYSSNNCTGSVFSGPGTLNSGTYSTTGTKVSTAGTFYWVASQAADSNNAAASSGCAAEPITVFQQVTNLFVQDVMTGLTADASGTVTYKAYSNACSGPTSVLLATSGPLSVTAGVAPPSNFPGGLEVGTGGTSGTVYFQATYTPPPGNGVPYTSPCTEEQANVT